MNTLTTFSISAVLLALCSGNVLANDDNYSQGISSQENSSSDSRRGRRGPPPEAYTACENKADGDTAQFENRRGKTVIGTCEQVGEKLVLRPNNRKGGNGKGGHGNRRKGPPPEAYTACESKSAGDTAQFESPRGETLTGTCEQDGEKLVLRPDRNKRRSRGEGTRGEGTRGEGTRGGSSIE